jgi:hypothetical protein
LAQQLLGGVVEENSVAAGRFFPFPGLAVFAR